MKNLILLLLSTCVCVFAYAGTINQPSNPQHGFIENKGQIIDQNNLPNNAVLYLYNRGTFQVQLKQNGFSYEVIKVETKPKTNSHPELAEGLPFASKFNPDTSDYVFYIHRVDISFVGANPKPEIIAYEPSSHYLNYYTTGTPEQGVTNVHHYKKVLYKNIYPNIDIEFLVGLSDGKALSFGKGLGEAAFKYNIIVYPGGNPNDIKLKFDGASKTSLTESGNILIETSYGNVEEMIPSSYQLSIVNAALKTDVKASFKLLALNQYGISVAGYSPTHTLVIDPVPWARCTWGSDGNAIAIDKTGNLIVTGKTQYSGMATSGAYQTTYAAGGADAFISKFNSTGAKIWSTYFGGSGSDVGYDVATDANANVLITGITTSTSNIASSGAYQGTYGGSLGPGVGDAFVAKFDSTGARLWSTYYGGSWDDWGVCITTDKYANILFGGITLSTTGIASTGSHQSSKGSGTTFDGYFAKFSPGGARLWASYYGGSTPDGINDIAVDDSSNVIIVGGTSSTNNIASSGSFQSTIGGYGDGFIAKFDSNGTRFWGTYYGGIYDDGCGAVIIDKMGNIYISGSTYSPNGIATSGSFQTSGGNNLDAFVSKFNINGIRTWGTYYGQLCSSNCEEEAYDIALSDTNVVIVGYANQTYTGIASTGAHQTYLNGLVDAIIVKLNASGTARLWATYYGGSGYERAYGVVTDTSGNIFITGNSTSPYSGLATYGTQQDSGFAPVFLAAFTSNGRLTDIKENIISGSQNVCPGTIPDTLRGNMPLGVMISAVQFKWLNSTTDSSLGFSAASGKNDTIYYVPPALTANTWFRRVVISGNQYDTSAAIKNEMLPKPVAGFSINNALQPITGNSFYFTDTSSTGISRNWDFGDTTFSTSSTPSKSYTAVRKYQVKLISINSYGCSDSITKNVTVLPDAPGTSASNLNFSNITTTSMTLTWTNGNGQRRIVLAKAGSVVNANPQNGTSYTASAAFGSGTQIGTGNFVVYKGIGNTVTLTGLNFYSQYHFAVIEYNGDTAFCSYQSTPYLTGNQTTLPVTWLSFSAKLNADKSVLLNWQTASEINNSHFEIERSQEPTANNQWLNIGRVQGNGTTNSISNYSFTDNQLSTEYSTLRTIYYRLRQVDFDGKYEYSKIVGVTLADNLLDDITLYPNPNSGSFTVSFSDNSPRQISVYNLLGNLVYTVSSIDNETTLNLPNMDRGVYFINVQCASGQFNSKIIVQ